MKALRSFLHALLTYRRETDRSLALWIALALLSFATQIVFRFHLLPGEFATLNTLLAVVALMTVPVLALDHAFNHFQPRDAAPERLAVLRNARLPLTQSFTIGWAILALLLFFPLLERLNLPRFSLVPVALANGVLAIGAIIGAAHYRSRDRLRFWAGLLAAAALVRFLLAIGLTASEPWAETGLAAGMLATLILLTPLLRQAGIHFEWKKARAAWRDPEFTLHLAATFSILLGLFLFTNADRIVAQTCFGRPQDNNLGLVPWAAFDDYQAAGLLGRALVWGTQPLLLVLLVRRAPLERTPRGVRQLFWIYVGTLVAAALLLHALAHPVARLFGAGDAAATSGYLSGFSFAMLPVGLVQGLGIFALASRRYPECFVIGGGGLVYAVVLDFIGRPQLMISYIFGGAAIALFLVLFIGVVRWGRKQP